MRTEIEINKDIINITMKINNEFPELSKYITEMPVTIPNKDSPEINITTLNDYYNSLNELLKKYTKNHTKNN